MKTKVETALRGVGTGWREARAGARFGRRTRREEDGRAQAAVRKQGLRRGSGHRPLHRRVSSRRRLHGHRPPGATRQKPEQPRRPRRPETASVSTAPTPGGRALPCPGFHAQAPCNPSAVDVSYAGPAHSCVHDEPCPWTSGLGLQNRDRTAAVFTSKQFLLSPYKVKMSLPDIFPLAGLLNNRPTVSPALQTCGYERRNLPGHRNQRSGKHEGGDSRFP